MLEAFGQSFLLVFGNTGFLLSLIAGMLAGILIGIIPAIGALLGCALFLPFAFLLKPETALPFMMAMLATSRTGGSITSVLLGIPGDTVNAATCIDGFPMTRKGQAGRGIGAAISASGMGSVVTVVLSLAIVPLVLPLVMSIRTADMVFLILLGISFIGVLGKGAMISGLVSGGLGMLVGSIGFQATTGAERFTFHSNFLYEGLALVSVALGLFALPEMFSLIASGGTIARQRTELSGLRQVFEGTRDIFRHWGLFLRSTTIGYIVGLLPGIGSSAATFVAYGQAKATSKHPDEFGKGTVEGVLAPESANNSCLVGDTLTTLALGIPGSGSMVLILAAFYMVGLVPGPDMMTKHLPLSLSLLLTIAVANLLAVAICFLFAAQLARIAFVPARILVPLITTIIFVGAFAMNKQFNDILVTFIFGILGLIMVRYKLSRPAFLLGFIMQDLFERNLFIALQLSGPLFFMRPISLIVILVIIGLFTYEPVKGLFRRRTAKS